MREIRLLRSRWRGLETELRSGLLGHERGNPGHRQGLNLTDHRASPRPYRGRRPVVHDYRAFSTARRFYGCLR